MALPAMLVAAAAHVSGAVKAWEEQVVMPSWEVGPPERHAIFDDPKHDIYPYTLQETLTARRADKSYTGVYLENEYIRVLVLPELGGRLHGAVDKTNNFEFFYWQKTIKPGLIGMTGAWISGGIEWNFPHGHRPSGFLPVDHRIVHNADGSATVWVGETEPIFRMRWLVGLTLSPGRSRIRADYIFINPTPHRHSFMFWATAATYAGDAVQAQYPGDMVTGHGKHEFFNWPVHKGVDLTWWKNVPNASSFFAFNNPSPWFGTYDHAREAGTVHVADPHVMPGKKLWTWGAGPSGRIWDDILSDGAGPYFEPQAGAWSDNQPDYHWIEPYEVKTAHDFWYPVRNLRGFHNANEDFAANTDARDGKAFAGVNATGIAAGCTVTLKNTRTGETLHHAVTDIAPDKPFQVEVPVAAGVTAFDLHLTVTDGAGRTLIEVRQQPPRKVDLPPGQKDPGDAKGMTLDELYHAGEWLDRFRRTPEALVYYQEALRRDAKDSRVNTEMGFLELKRGRWEEALRRLDTALERDADNARLYYGKGLALAGLRRFDEAYREFYRATYGDAWFVAAQVNLARLDLAAGRAAEALEKLAAAEWRNTELADIPALRAAALRKLGRTGEAVAAADRALALDPMHFMGGYEKTLAREEFGATWRGYMRGAAQNYLELAAAYAGAGLYAEAGDVIGRADAATPMADYFRGYLEELAGQAEAARQSYAKARERSPLYVFPHRLEEKAALEAALRQAPDDARAHLYLGNLLYGMGQREEGLAHWRKAAALEDGSALAWRNIGYAENHLHKAPKAAYAAYAKALAADRADGRALQEMHETAGQLRLPATERLALLEKHGEAVQAREGLLSTLADLRLEAGGARNLQAAYALLKEHHFHSWEGRYGIHAAWVEVNRALGDAAFSAKDYTAALAHYRQAGEYPKNLEVAAPTPDFQAHVNWDMARALRALGREREARECLDRILAERYGRLHLGTYYQALAHKALGHEAEYRALLQKLEAARSAGSFVQALVRAEKGGAAGAAPDPQAARAAVRAAQADVARAAR
jgi:tetratricopeptide (TPR) repeat protein